MKILIYNTRMRKRTGTEIVTAQFAQALHARGHKVAVFTTDIGQIGFELQAKGINVGTDLAGLPFKPEVIHFNQLDYAEEIFEVFSNVPIVYQNHMPSYEADPIVTHENIKQRFGISALACEKISKVTGQPTDGILGNFIDMSLFTPINRLPKKPKRWLVICQKKHGLWHLLKIYILALRYGAILHAVGPRVKRRIENIPNKASQYDLVFASARCAIEATGVGSGVIVTDYRGIGDFVNKKNVKHYLEGNFGAEIFTQKASLSALINAIGKFDNEAATAASKYIRETVNLDVGILQLERIYSQLIDS